MSEFEQLPPHPWLAELRADPAQAVADLFAGRTDKHPYARLRDAEFLLRVLPRREGREDEYDKLETALLEWLNERRSEPWTIRAKHGLPVYVAALVEALDAVQLLGLRRVASQLGELHNAYLRWLEPLRLGQATDPALELWRCHALLPNDGRFLPHWMRFCVEAGSTRPATYLGVALQGLRELPGEDAAANLRYALLGVAQHYLARQEQSDAQAELRRHCAALRFAYPYGPDGWRKEWDKALNELKRDQSDTVRAALDGKADAKARKPETKTAHAPQIDPNRFPDESKALATELRSGKSVAALWPRIERLLNETLAFCRQTATSYDFVRSLCWLGDLALKKTQTPKTTAHALLARLPDALKWERDNPYVWMLWAQCLGKLEAWDQCEWVYWEMRRYFPDNEHCRTELARLLMRQGRNEEAIALLREAAEHNPNDAPSRVELARLLMVQGKDHYPEAQRWLTEAAERNPNNAPSRVELAHLLSLSGNNPEAIALLEKFDAKHVGNNFVRISLQHLRSGQTMNLPRLGVEEHEQNAPAPAHETPDAAIVPAEKIAVVQDKFSQAAARVSRAAFRMALPNGLAQQGRAELVQTLANDPDDLLAAFYLDWAQCLPAGYKTPPNAYALAAAHSYRAADNWEELVKRFPEQRRLTWGLRWIASLRDGGTLPAQDWKQLEKLVQRQADENKPKKKDPEQISPVHAAGEAIVARLVTTLSDPQIKPDIASLDRQAHDLIALTIGRNLELAAITSN